MSSDDKMRQAIRETVRDRIEHDRRLGKAVPDTRAHEKAAQEIARRNERRNGDK